MRQLPHLVEKYHGSISRVFFDEGGKAIAARFEPPDFLPVLAREAPTAASDLVPEG